MAQDGRKVMLPLHGPPDPDPPATIWAKPELGTGCVKITPAHDPNDYEVWQRHRDRDRGSSTSSTTTARSTRTPAPTPGMDRFEALARPWSGRSTTLKGLLDRDRGSRDRDRSLRPQSKTIIEPYLSQAVVRAAWATSRAASSCGRGHRQGVQQRPAWRRPRSTPANRELLSPRPAGSVVVPPRTQERYHNALYVLNWLAEKRDWCISRQLWWGHRIPVWQRELSRAVPASWFELLAHVELLRVEIERTGRRSLGQRHRRRTARSRPRRAIDSLKARTIARPREELQVCLPPTRRRRMAAVAPEAAGLERDPDVLDTWFQLGALAAQHARLARPGDRPDRRGTEPARARQERRARLLLPRLLPRHRPRHHHPVGRDAW